MNILIVEDDEMLSKAMSHFLRELNHKVTLSGNGQDALNHISGGLLLDVIICDIVMPISSGPTFLLKLKKYFPEKPPKIIIVSGIKTSEKFLKQLDIQYDHFLPKPLNFDTLKLLLHEIKKS